MMTSLTRDVTIPPNAAPMITPMARSSTLPRIANSLNSLNIVLALFPLVGLRVNQFFTLLFVFAETAASQRFISSFGEYVRGTRGSGSPVSKGDDELVLRDLTQSFFKFA